MDEEKKVEETSAPEAANVASTDAVTDEQTEAAPEGQTGTAESASE